MAFRPMHFFLFDLTWYHILYITNRCECTIFRNTIVLDYRLKNKAALITISDISWDSIQYEKTFHGLRAQSKRGIGGSHGRSIVPNKGQVWCQSQRTVIPLPILIRTHVSCLYFRVIFQGQHPWNKAHVVFLNG
jgi:hypothetical protein